MVNNIQMENGDICNYPPPSSKCMLLLDDFSLFPSHLPATTCGDWGLCWPMFTAHWRKSWSGGGYIQDRFDLPIFGEFKSSDLKGLTLDMK